MRAGQKVLDVAAGNGNVALAAARHWYGPVLKAFAALDPPAQASLQGDLMALIALSNRSGDDSMIVRSEYLEIVINRY